MSSFSFSLLHYNYTYIQLSNAVIVKRDEYISSYAILSNINKCIIFNLTKARVL